MQMGFTFQKATKRQVKLRLAIFGPAGAGKTFSALRMATGMLKDGERIAMVDTEFGSSSMYADRFEFDMLTLDRAGVDVMVQAIQAAGEAGYAVLIIDSLSLAWQELLEEIDRLARAKYGGNTWSAWSEGTPKQKRLVRALLAYPGHVIATMRAKTEWTIDTDNRGKVKPVRVGLAPEQGKGIEYEFDMLMTISPDHEAHVIKDRTGKFQDQVFVPDEKFGRTLREWLETGEVSQKIAGSAEDGRSLSQKIAEEAERHAVGGNGGTPHGTSSFGSRPWSAEEVVRALQTAAEKWPGSKVTEGFFGAALGVLDEVGDRHLFVKEAFGKESSKDLTQAERWALARYVKPVKDASGVWTSGNEYLASEVGRVVEAALMKEQAQSNPLEEGVDG